MTAADPILRLESVSKHFGGLQRDRGFELRGPARHAHGADRPERRRQDHGVQSDHRGLPGRHRPHSARRRRHHPHSFAPAHRPRHRAQLPEHPADAASEHAGKRHGGPALPQQRHRRRAAAGQSRPAQPLARARRARRSPTPGSASYERATVGSLPYGVQKRIELVRALMARAAAAPARRARRRAQPGGNRGAAGAARDASAPTASLTLMVVEHDMHFIGALCEEVIVLDFGRKIAEGTPRGRSVRTSWCRKPISARRPPSRWSRTVQLEVHDLDVRYGRVHAVRGISLQARRGRDRGGARRQRRRQVVAAARGAGTSQACRRKRALRRPRHHALVDQRARARRARAGAGRPPHRDEAHHSREPADGRVQSARRPGGRRRDRRDL